eukprot:TsM_000226400 transcript=TsM_000226400 gene=TsM_000226400
MRRANSEMLGGCGLARHGRYVLSLPSFAELAMDAIARSEGVTAAVVFRLVDEQVGSGALFRCLLIGEINEEDVVHKRPALHHSPLTYPSGYYLVICETLIHLYQKQLPNNLWCNHVFNP